jgi:uncharacterized membrane protein YhhN
MPPLWQAADVNGYASVLLVALVVLGTGDVLGVVRADPDLSRLLRPAFGVVLLALAWLLRADAHGYGWWVLLGIAVAMVADVFLVTGRVALARRGVVGYAVSHLGYLLAVVGVGGARGGRGYAELGVVAAVCAAGAVAWLVQPILRENMLVGVPMLLGGLPLVLLVGAGWGSGQILLGAGAFALLVAALAVGYHRLCAPVAALPAMAAAAQHVGQIALVVGVLGWSS